MYTLANLGEHLRIVRESRNLRQSDLCAALGINPNCISRWETNNYFPRCEILVELVNICGVSLASMFVEPRFSQATYSMSAFAVNFRRLRALRQYTQRDVADATGVSSVRISLYETGHTAPRLDTLIRLGNLLDIDLDWLFTQKDTRYETLDAQAPTRQPGHLRHPNRRLVETQRTLQHVV